jgi:hypothetical protein
VALEPRKSIYMCEIFWIQNIEAARSNWISLSNYNMDLTIPNETSGFGHNSVSIAQASGYQNKRRALVPVIIKHREDLARPYDEDVNDTQAVLIFQASLPLDWDIDSHPAILSNSFCVSCPGDIKYLDHNSENLPLGLPDEFEYDPANPMVLTNVIEPVHARADQSSSRFTSRYIEITVPINPNMGKHSTRVASKCEIGDSKAVKRVQHIYKNGFVVRRAEQYYTTILKDHFSTMSEDDIPIYLPLQSAKKICESYQKLDNYVVKSFDTDTTEQIIDKDGRCWFPLERLNRNVFESELNRRKSISATKLLKRSPDRPEKALTNSEKQSRFKASKLKSEAGKLDEADKKAVIRKEKKAELNRKAYNARVGKTTGKASTAAPGD